LLGGQLTDQRLIEILDERDKQQQQKAVKFSECSNESLKNLITLLDITIVEGRSADIPTPSDLTFDLFEWKQDEEKDTLRAFDHLKSQLIKFGVSIGDEEGKYAMFDVHAHKTILSVHDKKTGNLTGGTDIIIAPYGIAEESLVMENCVATELKTKKRIDEGGIKKCYPQATLELIASGYFSRQLPLVLLTDLCLHAVVFKLVYNAFYKTFQIVRYSLSLEQAASMIANHLSSNCKPVVGIPYSHHDNPCSETITAFKKARQSELSDSLVWEHFEEMLGESEPGTRDRALAIKTLFSACDYPEPSYLSMYA
jgi:hypothetical protein